MLRLLTTADTEILAAAHARARSSARDFPEVRCANPATLDDVEAFVDRRAASSSSACSAAAARGRRAWRRCARAASATASR